MKVNDSPLVSILLIIYAGIGAANYLYFKDISAAIPFITVFIVTFANVLIDYLNNINESLKKIAKK